ncbi:Pr6Pr family membrane protein [Demequina aestuarii]|uniref:Pr6Pr family membrane protein n=1 Tax=Demequina aestuarii TaxID=327095 RepID=UPI00078654A3|nr:Pr6Pr family membrane protein [Demequina aestuarii]
MADRQDAAGARVALVASAAVAVTALLAYALQESDATAIWLYYSNLSAAATAVITIGRLTGRGFRSALFIGFAATSSLFSAIIFLAVIAPVNGIAEWSDPWSAIHSLSLHIALPIATVLALITVPHSGVPIWRGVATWMIPPGLYVTFLLIASAGGWIADVPYLFLSVGQYGPLRVLLHISVLLGVFSLCCAAISALQRRTASKTDHSQPPGGLRRAM